MTKTKFDYYLGEDERYVCDSDNGGVKSRYEHIFKNIENIFKIPEVRFDSIRVTDIAGIGIADFDLSRFASCGMYIYNEPQVITELHYKPLNPCLEAMNNNGIEITGGAGILGIYRYNGVKKIIPSFSESCKGIKTIESKVHHYEAFNIARTKSTICFNDSLVIPFYFDNDDYQRIREALRKG